MKIIGSGILYITSVENVPCILLVYSKNKQVWEDPGGRIEYEKCPLDTAIKELLEETANLIDVHKCVNYFKHNYIDIPVHLSTRSNHYYRSYIFYTDFIPNHCDFLDNLSILKSNKSKKSFLEMTDMILVPLYLFDSMVKSENYIQVKNKKLPVSKRLKKIIRELIIQFDNNSLLSRTTKLIKVLSKYYYSTEYNTMDTITYTLQPK
jgi:ADP-ribose pyrophosphatase YjhB (NUDIX family)